MNRVFEPYCAQESFVIEREGLSSFLFRGCPADCLLYQPAWRAKLRKGLVTTLAGVIWPVVGIAKWFTSLAPTAQVILVVVFLFLVLGAGWHDIIRDVVRAVLAK